MTDATDTPPQEGSAPTGEPSGEAGGASAEPIFIMPIGREITLSPTYIEGYGMLVCERRPHTPNSTSRNTET
jgi:hypothetical protein